MSFQSTITPIEQGVLEGHDFDEEIAVDVTDVSEGVPERDTVQISTTLRSLTKGDHVTIKFGHTNYKSKLQTRVVKVVPGVDVIGSKHGHKYAVIFESGIEEPPVVYRSTPVDEDLGQWPMFTVEYTPVADEIGGIFDNPDCIHQRINGFHGWIYDVAKNQK